jgi:hypothetical protein
MLALSTVVLEHTKAGQVHYDWLLTDPDDPQGLLWTARVPCHPRQWLAQRHWLLEPIHPHHRRYLTWQGPLTGDRGCVTRVDEGRFTPIVWQNGPTLIDLELHHLTGRVSVTRPTVTRWTAALLATDQPHAVQ